MSLELSIILFTLAASSPDGSHPWWNYPGLELWKFVNLTVFIIAGLYLHRRFGRPVREALRARSEALKRDLQKAREERDQALAKLAEVETRFENLDAEVVAIREKVRAEAEAEKQRLSLATEEEIRRMRDVAKREIDSTVKAAKQELRKFTAEESVRLAEDLLTREIQPEDDIRFASRNVRELGRSQV